MSRAVRVGTWNVREGLPDRSCAPEDRPAAMREFAKLVNEAAVDVLAVQEMDFDPAGRSMVRDTLRSATALEHVYAEPLSPSAYLPGHRSGLAIASRVPVLAHGLDLLPNPRLRNGPGPAGMVSYDKGLIAGTVRCADQDGAAGLTVVSLHALPFRRFGRQPEEPEFSRIWQALADLLHNYRDGPLVVAGDFNTRHRALVLDAAERSLSRAIGDLPTHRGQPTDDVLYTDELVQRAEPQVIRNFSDHGLFVVELARR